MKTHKNAVRRVRKHFPQVDTVVDATERVFVRVSKKDSASGRKKDPARCALARACKRMEGVDGAIINVGFSYLIKKNVAVRYKTSVAVGREITSFDRHQDFAAGTDYLLSAVSPSQQLGRYKTEKGRQRGPHLTTKEESPKIHRHTTEKIRVAA